MKEDQLMDGVERLMREAAAEAEARDDDERWEALSFGTAGEDEIRALEAAAADSVEAAQRLEAYRPIDRRTHQRFLERVQQELARPPGPGTEVTPAAGDAPAATEAAAGPERVDDDDAGDTSDAGRVVPWPARRGTAGRRRWLAPAVALAASLLWVLWPQPPIALPEYVLTAESGSQTIRGEIPDAASVLTLDIDDPFVLVLRPAQAAQRPVTARVFVERPGGLAAVALTSEVSGAGSIRLSGRFDQTLRATATATAEVDLWIVVAAKGSFPELEDVDRVRGGQHRPDDSWRLLRCRLQPAPRSRQ